MIVRAYLRTVDLAKAGQISVQQVRNYEASGFLPPAERSPSGYRRYTPRHLAALQTTRALIGGYGWQRTRALMQAVHRGSLATALALIDERHAELASKRVQLDQTLAALATLAQQRPLRSTPRHTHLLRVGAAAQQVGVRVSAIRFWEQQGLVQPLRDQSSRYRLYDEQHMRRLRVIVLLREAGYDFGVIRLVLDELAAGRPEKVILAVERRRADIARLSLACLSAMTTFHSYIDEFCADLVAAIKIV